MREICRKKGQGESVMFRIICRKIFGIICRKVRHGDHSDAATLVDGAREGLVIGAA